MPNIKHNFLPGQADQAETPCCHAELATVFILSMYHGLLLRVNVRKVDKLILQKFVANSRSNFA